MRRIAPVLATIMALVLVATPANAAQPPGVLDMIQGAFTGANAMLNLQNTAQLWAVKIFHWVLWVELIWVLVELQWEQNFEGVLKRLAMFAVLVVIGSYLVGNAAAYAQAATTELPTIAANFFLPGTNQGQQLTPSAIAGLGTTAADAISDAEGGNPIITTLVAIPSFICGLAIQLSFLFVGCESLAANVGLQFLFAIGGILFGLVGCRWTRPYAGKALDILICGGLLLIVINVVASTGVLVSDYVLTMVPYVAADSGNGVGMGDELRTIAAVGIAYFFFAMSIPAMLAWLGSGASPVRGMGDAVVGGVSSAVALGMGGGGVVAAMDMGGGAAAEVASIEAASKVA